jgi:hypothetical protein
VVQKAGEDEMTARSDAQAPTSKTRESAGRCYNFGVNPWSSSGTRRARNQTGATAPREQDPTITEGFHNDVKKDSLNGDEAFFTGN